MSKVSHISEVMGPLVDGWAAARTEQHEIARAGHPDLTDVLGRVWTWVGGDLYRHDSMAWTKGMVTSPRVSGPSQDALANANYTWCDRCRELARP